MVLRVPDRFVLCALHNSGQQLKARYSGTRYNKQKKMVSLDFQLQQVTVLAEPKQNAPIPIVHAR